MSKPEKLVAMAEQIAGFFHSQPGDQAKAVADHLHKFWTPGMRQTLVAHVEAGGLVNPLTRKAVEKLRTVT